jgi:hypothetical protein
VETTELPTDLESWTDEQLAAEIARLKAKSDEEER